MVDEDLFTPDHYTVGAVDLETAKRYVRFLDRHANYGGHTGLPKEMRNKNPNESLETSLGIYDTVDVYSLPPDKCPIGTVVNFTTDINVNPEGLTYVYPCTDIDAPIGYMITNAEPDVCGVCLVHGVIEVPLYYFDETEEKKDFVEYDIESESFKFADSGYPVFNVYQDADGDWIAIILFGNDNKKGAVYDGPFATTIAGVTGSTMYVNVASGDFIQENVRSHFDDENLMSDIALVSGETLWLNTYLSGGTRSYSFEARTAPPTQSPGGSLWYRIAENTGNDLVQLQYGDIFNDIQHLHVESVSGSTAFIRISGYSSSNRSEDNIMLRGIGCSFNTLGQNDIGIIIDGGTGGGGGSDNQNLYTAIKGGTPAICISGSTSYVNIVGSTNTSVALGQNGEIVIGSTCSVKPYKYTGSFAAVTRDVVDGLGNVTHYVDIVDTKSRDHYGDYAGFVHIGSEKYSVNNYTTSFIDGDVVYLVGTFSDYSSNNLSLAFQKIHPVSMDDYFPTINDNQFCVRICYAENGKMIQAQYGDIVQPARYVGDGSTTQIIGNTVFCIGSTASNQSLYASFIDDYVLICLTNSQDSVKIVGGTNTSVEEGSDGEIIINTQTGSGSSSEYQVILSGGTTASQLQKDKKYIVWIKDEQAEIPSLSIQDLQNKYSSLDCSFVSTSTNVILELPVLNGLNNFCFIDVDNQLHPCNVTIIDTEKVGIVGGNWDLNNDIFRENNQVYINDSVYKRNALCLSEYRYRIMYDPEGLVAKVQGGTISGSAKWFVWRIA